jgi:hypothetical protein
VKHIVIAAFGALLATAGSAGTTVAQDRSYGPPPPPPCCVPPPPCRDGGPRDAYGVCVCDYEVDFYRPTTPWTVVRAGGPGVRVRGRPVTIASGRIDIQGPPIYVEAPPIRIQAPQIYLHAPEVHISPSDVTVEPPEIHFSDCEDLHECAPVSRDYAPGRSGDGERG